MNIDIDVDIAIEIDVDLDLGSTSRSRSGYEDRTMPSPHVLRPARHLQPSQQTLFSWKLMAAWSTCWQMERARSQTLTCSLWLE